MLQEFIDVFNIIQRVVDEELQLRNDTQLLSHACAQFVANLPLVVIDVLHNLLGAFAGEYTQVSTTDAKVGTYAAGAYTNQHTTHGAGLLLEDIAQLLLNESGNFILSCCFHIWPLSLTLPQMGGNC